MDDVEAVARAVRPNVWRDEGLTAFERKQTPSMREIAKTDALKHIAAYKAWLRANGWVIARREPDDGMNSIVAKEFGADREAALGLWRAMLLEGELKEWQSAKL